MKRTENKQVWKRKEGWTFYHENMDGMETGMRVESGVNFNGLHAVKHGALKKYIKTK